MELAGNPAVATVQRKGLLAVFFLVSIVVVAATAACTGQSGSTNTPAPTAAPFPTPTPTPPPDPRAILARTAERLPDEKFLGFTLEHPVGNTPLATGLVLARAEGAAQLPDRFRLFLDMEASGTVFKLEVIVVEDAAYMTNLFSGAWEPTPKEQIPFRFDFVTQSLTALLSDLSGPALVGSEEIDGRQTYHISGMGPTNALARLIPGTIPDSELPVELWVNRDDLRLRRVRLAGPLVTNDLPDTVRQLDLQIPESPPEIEAPETAPPGR